MLKKIGKLDTTNIYNELPINVYLKNNSNYDTDIIKYICPNLSKHIYTNLTSYDLIEYYSSPKLIEMIINNMSEYGGRIHGDICKKIKIGKDKKKYNCYELIKLIGSKTQNKLNYSSKKISELLQIPSMEIENINVIEINTHLQAIIDCNIHRGTLRVEEVRRLIEYLNEL